MSEKENQIIVSGGIPSLNNYESYKRYVKSIPNLSVEDEESLVQQMLQEKSIDAAKQLVMSQLKNVVYVAEQFKGYGLQEEDLVQEGNIGLMKAVKNFNPEKKVRLYTYALIWIKAEIQMYVMKNLKQVSLPSSKNMKKLFFNFRKIQKEMIDIGVSKDKLLKFMSAKLEVSEEDVLEAQNYFLSNDVSIYDNTESDEKNTNPMLEHLLIEEKNPESILEELSSESHKNEVVEEMLKVLNERQRKVIEERFMSENKKTHKEIANEMSISNERVRQIESEAIVKMKKSLALKYSEEQIQMMLQ